MVFFQGMFSDRSTNWPGNVLESVNQFNELIKNSYTKPQFIFKHSTRCSISIFVLNDFISSNIGFDENIEGWYLDILKYRSISNLIADNLIVNHQSPQLIIIIDGIACEYNSHENIKNIKLSDYFKI
tara:strand:+ start:1215 stop:1595 length:381 start_codon:yes stop_codon:yes gene_type:complete